MSTLHGRTLAILNPTAGRGDLVRRWETFAASLPDDVAVIQSSASVEQAAREAAEQGAAEVIAVGGDGTVQQVLNGILQSGRRDVILGVVPWGSANDFAVGLRTAQQHQVADSLWSGTLRIDIGLAIADKRRRHFCNVCGIGLTARIARRAQRLRRYFQEHRYTVALLQSACFDLACVSLSHRCDDEMEFAEHAALLFCASLGPREGGFVIASDANLCCGRFKTLLVEQISFVELLPYLPQLLRGSLPHNDQRLVRQSARKICLRSEPGEWDIHLDGEPFVDADDNCAEVVLEVLPAHLSVRLYD